MPITSVRELQQTLTASMAQRSPAVQDLVYNSTPLAAVLRERGRIKTASGPEIRIPLMIDKLSAQWFTGYDKLRVDPKELINSAVFTWKRVVSMFSLTGTELMFNEGRGQILDLMSTYLEAAEMSAAEEFETALHGDGTGTGGRSIIGMGGAVPIITNSGTSITSIVSTPPGVVSCTSSPSRAFSRARATGETQLTSSARLSASSMPLIVIVRSSPRALT